MSETTEKAIFAGGCFWGMQDLFRKRPGVVSTRVGYTGGDVPNATYRKHGTHAEAIEIVFDPDLISYRDLLELFFQIHDPTTMNRQGNDIGTSYRSAIFYLDEEQRRVAEAHGATPSQIRLAWLMRRSPTIVTIPGTLSLEHLRENLAALEIELTEAEFDQLSG